MDIVSAKINVDRANGFTRDEQASRRAKERMPLYFFSDISELHTILNIENVSVIDAL